MNVLEGPAGHMAQASDKTESPLTFSLAPSLETGQAVDR